MSETGHPRDPEATPSARGRLSKAALFANAGLSVQLGLLAISFLMVVSMWIVQSKTSESSGPALVDPNVAPRWCLTAGLAMLVAGILLAVQLASASWREGRALGLGVTMAGLAGVGFAWGSPKEGLFWIAWVVLGWSAILSLVGLGLAMLAVPGEEKRPKSL